METNKKRFTDWITVYRGILIKITRSFSQSPEDYDDLFQEILLQVWKSISAFREESAESTWIYRVALNRALLWKKQESKRKDVLKIFETDINYSDNDGYVKHERSEALYIGIRQLNKPDRALIILALDGLSYLEMSKIIEISESNVGARLTRIKKKLSKLVKID